MEEMNRTHKEPAWGWYAGLGAELIDMLRKSLGAARSAVRQTRMVWGRSALHWSA